MVLHLPAGHSVEIQQLEDEDLVGFHTSDVKSSTETCGHNDHDHDHDHDHTHPQPNQNDNKPQPIASLIETEIPSISFPHNLSRSRRACTKTVETLILNDFRLHEIKGIYTESFASTVFNSVVNHYNVGSFDCDIELKLIGQLTFRDAMPSTIEQNSCDQTSSQCKDSTSADEVDNKQMLQTLGEWIETNIATLKTVFKGMESRFCKREF